MSRAEDYRRYAGECVRVAQAISDPHEKARLLEMAQKWRDLSNKAEEAEGPNTGRTYVGEWGDPELTRTWAAHSDSRFQHSARSRNLWRASSLSNLSASSQHSRARSSYCSSD